MVSFGNVIITFRNYVRIMLGSYVRLTLGSYVIKPCKWEVTSDLRYKDQVRITSEVTLDLRQVWEQKKT